MKFFLSLIASFCVVMVGLTTASTDCQFNGRYLEQLDNGTIDWTDFKITAWNSDNCTNLDSPQVNSQLASTGSFQPQAVTELMNIVLSLPVDSNSRVSDRISGNRLIRSQLEEIITSKPTTVLANDQTIALQFNLKGAFLQLLLPEEIKQLSEIQTVTTKTKGKTSQQQPNKYSGLVIDARAIKASPALVPEIRDENGRQIYGTAFISREFAVQYGAGLYACCMNEKVKQKVGKNPLSIRALKAIGPNQSTLVVSNGDAAKLRSVSSHLSFLKQARVAILLSEENPPLDKGKP